MSWDKVNANNGRTRIGYQSALGTISSNLKDLVLRGPANPLGALARKMLERRDERRLQHDVQAPVKGLQSGAPAELMVDGKRLVTRLSSSATPVAFSHASALSHQLVLRAGLGGELAPAAGSTAAGTPAVDSVDVASGHGSRFIPGQIAIFNGAPRRVLTVSTDTLVPFPDLAGAPSAGDAVLNAYNYHLGVTGDTAVFTLQHAHTESGTAETQRQALGFHGGLSLTLTIGEIVGYKLSGNVLSFTDPGNLSLTMESVADDMGAPMVWEPTCYLGSTATDSAPSDAQLSTIEVTIPRKWERVPGSGGVEGVCAVLDTASHDTPGKVTISGHMGLAAWTAFAADTERYLLAYSQDGSGSDQRTLGVYFPRLVIEGDPVTELNGDVVFFKCTMRMLMARDVSATPTPGSTAPIAISPMIVFLG